VTHAGRRNRLCEANLPALAAGIGVPDYDRSRVSVGVVHFGPGSFFRAHTAWHIDRLLARDLRWGICAVSLRTGSLARALAEQDFLYTLAELDAKPVWRIIGALKDYIVASEKPQLVFRRLTDAAVKVVTITVTEKGYCLDAQGRLDFSHPDIVHDLSRPKTPNSLIGWLIEGLRRRRAAGLSPFTVLSCDNLVGNGPKLRQAAIGFARALHDPDFARWIENEVHFPASMVDSITPHADDAFLEAIVGATGLRDEAPVRRERFTQWVIEDEVAADFPDLASVGVTLTKSVKDYELAKLRLLNGAHSALAYLGLAAGHATVFEAMSDASLAHFVEAMMRDDTVRTLQVGFDVPAYIDQLIARLKNPAIAHRLRQIAADGSVKIPYRFLEPAGELLAANKSPGRIPTPVAAWMRFVVDETRAARALEDPLAGVLAEIGRKSADSVADIDLFLSLESVFPGALRKDPRFVKALGEAYANLAAAGARSARS
jgi:fructuronate reductase